MRKTSYFILFALALTFIKSLNDENWCFRYQGHNLNECKDLKLAEGYYKCCFAESITKKDNITKNINICINITKNDYENLEEFKRKAKKRSEDSGYEVLKYEVQCSSNYIFISLLLLIQLLF